MSSKVKVMKPFENNISPKMPRVRPAVELSYTSASQNRINEKDIL